ncbi:hypothetical protein COLO4_27488 [Corchorus olitorius]|uniref:Uncharacterized protein n=1 Tax=Corchorus olitorius TaxID=93759 RepID=A0A1R3HR12_9ROSI|nr:hypothetical protein COLO4_27488 [Corchorus olitorius]
MRNQVAEKKLEARMIQTNLVMGSSDMVDRERNQKRSI